MYNDKAISTFNALLNRIERELYEQQGITSLSGDELDELDKKMKSRLGEVPEGELIGADVFTNNMFWSTIRDLLEEKQRESAPAATPAAVPAGNRTAPPSGPEPNESGRQPHGMRPGPRRAGRRSPPSPLGLCPGGTRRPPRRRGYLGFLVGGCPADTDRSGFLGDPVIAHMEAGYVARGPSSCACCSRTHVLVCPPGGV